jgi:phosphoribosylformylglycinamidine synthase
MPSPRVLVVRAPGTNCDSETAYAFARAGGLPELVHINRLLEEPSLPDQYQILCVPGGFSYGDDVGAGRILASQFRHHLVETLTRFRDQGKLILGICNGFQVLIQSGLLLPGDGNGAGPMATLTWNDSGRFEDRWVYLAAGGSRSIVLRGVESLYLPVAHAEGKFVTRDSEACRQLQAVGCLALRYIEPSGAQGDRAGYPFNPNGSMEDVAGICDETGQVLGLMPHPERHVGPLHHPRWTRQDVSAEGDGMQIFRNAVDYFGR